VTPTKGVQKEWGEKRSSLNGEGGKRGKRGKRRETNHVCVLVSRCFLFLVFFSSFFSFEKGRILEHRLL
jgi:hypothetical protein